MRPLLLSRLSWKGMRGAHERIRLHACDSVGRMQSSYVMCIHQSSRDTGCNVKCENASGKRDVLYSSTESALVNDAALLIIIVQCTEHSMRTPTKVSQHTSLACCFYLTLTREMNPAPLSLPSQPSPCPAAAPKLGWFPFRGLTVLVL